MPFVSNQMKNSSPKSLIAALKKYMSHGACLQCQRKVSLYHYIEILNVPIEDIVPYINQADKFWANYFNVGMEKYLEWNEAIQSLRCYGKTTKGVRYQNILYPPSNPNHFHKEEHTFCKLHHKKSNK